MVHRGPPSSDVATSSAALEWNLPLECGTSSFSVSSSEMITRARLRLTAWLLVGLKLLLKEISVGSLQVAGFLKWRGFDLNALSVGHRIEFEGTSSTKLLTPGQGLDLLKLNLLISGEQLMSDLLLESWSSPSVSVSEQQSSFMICGSSSSLGESLNLSIIDCNLLHNITSQKLRYIVHNIHSNTVGREDRSVTRSVWLHR